MTQLQRPQSDTASASADGSRPLLRIGIPKGSLQDATVDLFDRAGYNINISSRSYFPEIDDPQLSAVMFRAQEMSRYVEDGVIDLGITGQDWIIENESDVHEVCELSYSKATAKPVRWVLAVPEESDYHKPEDLAGGIIATELINTTRRYFEQQQIAVKKVEFSWGATEVKARLVDAIVDVTETGSSLRANKLRVIDELLTSTTRLIANKQAWADPARRQKIEDLAVLLQGAIAARSKVGLKLNVPRASLEAVLAILPAEQSPTINDLADGAWVAIEVVVDERVERELVPSLRRAGATAIFSYPLNKVVP
ncbi:ATP phosphoribosyltransferase [Phycisphaerales bacterium AB-hyl4]|uniref:ATP phosphoribosyltransferase n=1 Tax=Natronomicrosphaera hydrolytica TaxID=3242702 RepID=A0ABV4U0S5_9BACT